MFKSGKTGYTEETEEIIIVFKYVDIVDCSS